MKKHLSYHWYALISVLIWSASFLGTKLALRGFTPASLASLRLLSASVCLVVLLIIRKKPFPTWKALLRFLPAGVIGVGVYQVCFGKGNTLLTSATFSVLISLSPILTALLARIFLKEKLSARQYLAVLISFVGVGVMSFLGLAVTGINILWGLLAAFCLSVYYLIQRINNQKYDAFVSTAYGILMGTLLLSFRLPAAIRELTEAPAVSVWAVILLGISCSAIAYCTWGKALALAENAASVSNYKFSEPFLAALLGAVFLQEKLTLATVAGGILIVGGLVLFAWRPRKRDESITEADPATKASEKP